MKNSRIAAQLRSLAGKPSLESADAESTTETGPGSEQVVKTDVDTSAESPNQTTEETTPAEGKDLSVTTKEVGERSDLESAQTQIKPGEGEPTEAALEGLQDKVLGVVDAGRAVVGAMGKVARAERYVKRCQNSVEWLQKQVSDGKAAVAAESDPKRKARIQKEADDFNEDLQDAKQELKKAKEKLAELKAKKVSNESLEEGEVADNSDNVDASAVTGPDGEGVVKQELDTHGESPNQTTEETTPAENQDLSTKTVEVGERSELESAETTADQDGENVVVSTESLTLAAIGLVGLGAAFSTWAAGKFQSEVKQIEALQKKIKATKEDIDKSEREFIDRAKAVAAKAKPAVSQEGIGAAARAAVSGVATTAIGAGAGFMVGGPMGAAVGALLSAGAWNGDWKHAVEVNKAKRAELQKLELQLADRQLELATRVAAAEKQYKVSNEGLSEFDALTVTTESFKTVIGLIFSQEKRLEWSLAQSPKWQAEVEADIKDCRERIAAAKKADNPAKVRALEEELGWLIECKEEGEATDKAFAERLAKIKAKKAAAQKVVSTEAFDDAAAAAAAAFAEGAAGAAEAAAAAAGSDTGEVAETAAAVAEDVAEQVAADAGAEAGAEAGEEAAEDVADEDLAAGDAELDGIETSIDEGESHVEEYEQAAATMESLIEALQDAQRSGGLTPQAARFATITMESVGIRLTGAPFQNAHGESAMPSLESFGGTMRRDEATTISLENAKEWFAKIWEVLKNTWEQIRSWVANFVKALFSQGERYKQRAQKIQQAAQGVNGQPKNRTVAAGAAGAKIALNGTVGVDNVAKLMAFATELKNAGNPGQLVRDAITFVSGLSTDSVSSMKAESGETVSQEAVDGGVTLEAFGPFKNEYNNEGISGYATDVLPGNYRLVATAVDSLVLRLMAKAGGNGPTKAFKVVRVSEQQQAEDATVNVWTGPQIGTVAGQVIKVIDLVMAARKDWEVVTQVNLNLPAALSQAADEDQKFVRGIVSGLQRALHSQASSIKAMGQALVGTSGDFLNVASAHLKEYGVNVGVVDKAVAGAKDAASKASDAVAGAAGAVKDAVTGDKTAAA